MRPNTTLPSCVLHILIRRGGITGIKAKVENTQQYVEYLEELKPIREELGINLKEDLYPDNSDSPYFNP